MSLGLVSYDDSDESDSDVDTETAKNITTSVKNSISSSGDVSVAPAPSRERHGEVSSTSEQISDEEMETNDDSEKSLHLPESKVNILNTDIDVKCLTSTNKRNGPVKIMIPSLNEVEDDAEPPSKKKLKPSPKGSGLFALLPSPKSSLVPRSVVNSNRNVTNKKSNLQATKSTKPVPVNKVPAVNKPTLITYEDSGDEEESAGPVDFFSLDSKEVVAAPVVIDLDLPETSDLGCIPRDSQSQSSSWPEVSSSLPSSSVTQEPVSEYPTTEFMSCSNENLELNQEAMQQLCGRRDRLKVQEVDLIDVSGDAIMPDAREWLTKQLTEETSHRSSHKKRDGPTTQQKRKHQITYLAFQAKENELELKNQWANNRMSRKQTQAKYGF